MQLVYFQWSFPVTHVGLPFLQNSLIQPTLGVETSGTVTRELLQGLGEIAAEDTNNILVQVVVCGEIYLCS